MKKGKSTIFIAAAFVVALLGTMTLNSPISLSEASAPQKESVAAPDFAMLDIQGESVSLRDYVGAPIVLNFWASWCGPCRNEMPVFNAVAAELEGKVDFIMVNLTDGSRETIEGATEFISQQGYTFPIYFDTLYEGAQAYSVSSIPVTYFIDEAGNLQAYYTGSMNEQTLRKGIDMIYQGE